MKAFYLIHTAIVLEVILTVLVILKLNEITSKIKKINKNIKKNTNIYVKEIHSWHEKVSEFNKKCEEKMSFASVFLNLTVNVLKKLAIQKVFNKIFFPKKGFLAKMLNYKVTIFWFLLSFFFFKNKKA